MDTTEIGAGRHQTWNQGVLGVVLGRQDDGTANWRPTFSARPLTAGRHGRDDLTDERAFARARLARDRGVFSARNPRWPYPFYLLGLDVGGATHDQTMV